MFVYVSLLVYHINKCPHCWGIGFSYGLHLRRTGHNPPRAPSVDRWALTNANAAGTNGLTCLPKHGGAPDNKFITSIIIYPNDKH
jgi:hypothetical protein